MDYRCKLAVASIWYSASNSDIYAFTVHGPFLNKDNINNNKWRVKSGLSHLGVGLLLNALVARSVLRLGDPRGLPVSNELHRLHLHRVQRFCFNAC